MVLPRFYGSLEASKEIRDFLIGLGCLSVSSVAIVIGFELLTSEELYGAFFQACIAWGGYLLAHYSLIGSYIDEKKEEGHKPELEKYFKLVSGMMLKISGIIITIKFISSSLLKGFIGMEMVFAGYMIIHHEITGHFV